MLGAARAGAAAQASGAAEQVLMAAGAWRTPADAQARVAKTTTS